MYLTFECTSTTSELWMNWFAAIPKIYTPIFWICTMVIPQYFLTNLEVACKWHVNLVVLQYFVQSPRPYFHSLVMNPADMLCYAYVWYWEENICLFLLSPLLLPHIPIKYRHTLIPDDPAVFAMLMLVWCLSCEHFHCSKSFIRSVCCGMPEGGTQWRACLTLTFEVILSASYFGLLKVFLVL